jgi:putative colanic acid biosynthesis UDP-glucose lipid carrier transferase
MKDADSGFDQNLQQVTKDDNRVTNIGRFLRKYSLDELPQLINVIKGDMSLVGPRPHAVVHNEIYRYKINGYMQRHSIKPGMTGLAQIKGFRGETKNIKNMKDRINADLEYIQNWNLILDFKILVKTFLVMIDGSAF